jgi:hypothetical protein
MNWREAVALMKQGKHLVRQSQQKRELVGYANDDGPPIYECGPEAVCIRAAWTVDEKYVFVFQGSESRTSFMPEDCHKEATDWIEYIDPFKGNENESNG